MMKKRKQVRLDRWKALLYKDICDLRWNGQVLLNFIGGIFLISLLAFVPEETISLSFLLGFIFVMLTMLMQGNLMVEEQEQRTIRRLKQAGFSFKEIYIYKMIVTFTATVLVLVIFSVLYGNHFLFSIKLFILVLPIMIIMLVAGTFLGIKTKNTIEISLYGVPIIILYFFVEGLLMNSSKEDMPWLVVFPNYHLHYGIDQLYFNEPFLSYLVVPVIWMTAVVAVFVSWYRNQSFD
ncbi:ABC transporter permease [Oceanobacillus sp. FSL W8-0428]|uniref:ABC transporter permease n=1 Tax=Oceanobacillus TaxID=182709 RepID=UPI0030F5FFEB